jgi:hypothetical protein
LELTSADEHSTIAKEIDVDLGAATARFGRVAVVAR